MEIVGIKPGTQKPERPGPKLAVGERLSLCGQFAINGSGQWRELPREQAVERAPEFEGILPDGRSMPAELLR